MNVCVYVCVCLHPGGLEVTDKSASGPINNSCGSDSALTKNTPRDLCCQGGINSWVDYFTFRQHLETSEAGRGGIVSSAFEVNPFPNISYIPKMCQTALDHIDFLPRRLDVEQYPGDYVKWIQNLIWSLGHTDIINTLFPSPTTHRPLSLKQIEHSDTLIPIFRQMEGSIELNMTPTVNTGMRQDCCICEPCQHRRMLSVLTVDRLINSYWW